MCYKSAYVIYEWYLCRWLSPASKFPSLCFARLCNRTDSIAFDWLILLPSKTTASPGFRNIHQWALIRVICTLSLPILKKIFFINFLKNKNFKRGCVIGNTEIHKRYFVIKIVLTYCEKKIIQTVKGQSNFWWQNAFLACSWRFLISNKLEN